MIKLWILKESYPEGFCTYTAFDTHEELLEYLQDAKTDPSTKLELRTTSWEQMDLLHV